MSFLGDDFARLAWTQLWQVTVVIVAVAVVTRLACVARPHLAYLLWCVVLLKCLTPPVWSSPTGAFSWLARERAPQVAVNPAPPVAPWAITNVATPPQPAQHTPRAVTVALPRQTFSWSAATFIAWAVGAFGSAFICAARWRRWIGVVRRAREPLPDTSQMFAELVQAFRLRRHIALRITPEPVGPFTLGWWRPVVVVPTDLETAMAPEELLAALAHELTHVRRWDALTAWLQVAAQIVWWFHPLVWLANRQMNRAREGACDEETIATLRLSPKVYAASLVRALELRPEIPAFAGAVGMRAIDVTKARLEHIMTQHSRFSRRTPASAWLAGLIAACLALPGAALAWQVQTPPDAAPTTRTEVEETSPRGPSEKHLAALKEIRALGGVVESLYGEQDGGIADRFVLVDLTQWTGAIDQISLLNDLDQVDSVGVKLITRVVRNGLADPDPPATAQVNDAWLKAVGGLPNVRVVHIGVPGDYTAEGLSQLRAMPKLQTLQLHGVTDEQLRGVNQLPGLRTLSVEGPAVTDHGLANASALTNLNAIYVSCPRVSGAFLEQIKACQDLQSLFILQAAIAPANLDRLIDFPKLEELLIIDGMRDEWFVPIAKLPLKRLFLGGPFTDAGLARLKEMKQLQALDLGSRQITGNGLVNLTGLIELRHLMLESPKIHDEHLDQLRTLKNLEELRLDGAAVTDAKRAKLKEIFPALKEPKGLVSFNFVPIIEAEKDEAIDKITALGGQVVQSPRDKEAHWIYLNKWTGTADDLELLKQVKNLEQVETTIIFSVQPQGAAQPEGEPEDPRGAAVVSDAWLAKFAELPDLKALHISSQAGYTAAGVEALAKAPKLESLWLDRVGDEVMPAIARLANLTDLSIGNGEVTDDGLAQLKPLTKLRRLSLTSRTLTGEGLKELGDWQALEELQLPFTALNDAAMAAMPQFKNLKKLAIYNTKVTDAGLAHLAGMKELDDLRVDENAIGDDGVKHLAGLTKMRYLGLGRTDITGAALAYVAPLTELRVLNLYGTRIRDNDLEHLKGLNELFSVALFDTEVTEKGVEQLHEWLPKTKEYDTGAASRLRRDRSDAR